MVSVAAWVVSISTGDVATLLTNVWIPRLEAGSRPSRDRGAEVAVIVANLGVGEAVAVITLPTSD